MKILLTKAPVDFRSKKQYLIIGSNNFWYAGCLKSKGDIKAELEEILKCHKAYEDPETGHHPEMPEKFYVYEAKEIGQFFPNRKEVRANDSVRRIGNRNKG
jgi:hypothetical protein